MKGKLARLRECGMAERGVKDPCETENTWELEKMCLIEDGGELSFKGEPYCLPLRCLYAKQGSLGSHLSSQFFTLQSVIQLVCNCDSKVQPALKTTVGGSRIGAQEHAFLQAACMILTFHT